MEDRSRILIVDDDPDIRRVLTLLLRDSYEISQAVGYRSSQYFSQAFQKKTGIFPKDYRRGEDG